MRACVTSRLPSWRLHVWHAWGKSIANRRVDCRAISLGACLLTVKLTPFFCEAFSQRAAVAAAIYNFIFFDEKLICKRQKRGAAAAGLLHTLPNPFPCLLKLVSGKLIAFCKQLWKYENVSRKRDVINVTKTVEVLTLEDNSIRHLSCYKLKTLRTFLV